MVVGTKTCVPDLGFHLSQKEFTFEHGKRPSLFFLLSPTHLPHAIF